MYHIYVKTSNHKSGVLVVKESQIIELWGISGRTPFGAAISAIKEGLLECSPESRIIVHSDIKYIIECGAVYSKRWRRNGWKKQDGFSPANLEKWQELIAVADEHSLSWQLEYGDRHPHLEHASLLAKRAGPAGKEVRLDTGLERAKFPIEKYPEPKLVQCGSCYQLVGSRHEPMYEFGYPNCWSVPMCGDCCRDATLAAYNDNHNHMINDFDS